MGVAYFLTFRTYGTWLHGDPRGSVDAANNAYGEMQFPRDDGLRRRRELAMSDSAMLLDTTELRRVVREAIERTCMIRGWELLGLNVRTNHVHVVLTADESVEKVLSSLKAWATRSLREKQLVREGRPVWAHHGSTRYLRDEASLEAAVQYVLFEQGSTLD